MSKSLKDVVNIYFQQFDKENGKWKCKCEKILIQRKGTGTTNLQNHIKLIHPEYFDFLSERGPIDKFVNKNCNNKSCYTIFGWIEQICIGPKPFNFVEDQIKKIYLIKPYFCEYFKKVYGIIGH